MLIAACQAHDHDPPAAGPADAQGPSLDNYLHFDDEVGIMGERVVDGDGQAAGSFAVVWDIYDPADAPFPGHALTPLDGCLLRLSSWDVFEVGTCCMPGLAASRWAGAWPNLT